MTNRNIVVSVSLSVSLAFSLFRAIVFFDVCFFSCENEDDSSVFSESQFIDAPQILKALLTIPECSKYTPKTSIKSLVWNDKKITA